MSGLTVAVVGLGYFSQFHLDAWQTDPNVSRVLATDINVERRAWAARDHEISVFETLEGVLNENPDIVDIVAPPSAHAMLIKQVARDGRIVVCQKPFCTSLQEAKEIANFAAAHETRLLIHENFRFQPWHRTIKHCLEKGLLDKVYQARFDLRPGDGRGPEAYLSRQPAFRSMERLLIHETGVHFVDLFQWLFGPITTVYADLSQLNPVLLGEDAGVLMLSHEGGVRSVFDGNRLSDHATDNPRRTMGEMWIEGEGGTLHLNGHGQLQFRPFGTQDIKQIALVSDMDEARFGGGCVAHLCRHVSAAAVGQGALENEAQSYLSVIAATEAAYQSAREGRKIHLSTERLD